MASPLPSELMGTPAVEDWIDPTEQPPGDGAADLDAWQWLAERRLREARWWWSADQAAAAPPVTRADLVASRSWLPATPGDPIAEAEITEVRRWLLEGHNCQWRDADAFLSAAVAGGAR